MDIFKFNNDPSTPTKMEHGEIINGIKKVMWIERYAEAGEFTINGYASSRIQEKLPIGTFISHIDTREIMQVENHEISDDEAEDPEITITGRGYETILENRWVGVNRYFPASANDSVYAAPPLYLAGVISSLIENHIDEDSLPVRRDLVIPYINVSTTGIPIEEDYFYTEPQLIKRGSVYERLIELLGVRDYGIKVIRPPTLPIEETTFLIHKGTDRSKTIYFSHDAGEVINADYLWSNRELKNVAYVTSKWIEILVGPFDGSESVNARIMNVDASFLDNNLEQPPSAIDFRKIWKAMKQLAITSLSNQNEAMLAKAEIVPTATRFKYRTDYDVGDFVTVLGSYHTSSVMRVKEYVEIEDETGSIGYPTLELSHVTTNPIVVTLTDGFMFKRGSVIFYGNGMQSVDVTFITPFPTIEYEIHLSETVTGGFDPVDEINDGSLRATSHTTTGFTITRNPAVREDEPEHTVRIDWLAIFAEDAEGTIEES